MEVKVKQIDFGFNGVCDEHQELRRDVSCYRGEKLAKIVLKNKDKLKTVASYQAGGRLSECLEEAFRLTNSVDRAWYENPEISVSEYAKGGCRSTSVGDVIEIAGVQYMVDGYGFICLDDVEGD